MDSLSIFVYTMRVHRFVLTTEDGKSPKSVKKISELLDVKEPY